MDKSNFKIPVLFEGLSALVKWDELKAEKLCCIYEATVKGALYGANKEDLPILNELFSEGYIERPQVGISLKLTPIGYNIASAGNYTDILLKKHEKEYQENIEVEFQRRLKTAQLTTAEFVAKTRYIPLVVSIIAIILSAIALIKSFYD